MIGAPIRPNLAEIACAILGGHASTEMPFVHRVNLRSSREADTQSH